MAARMARSSRRAGPGPGSRPERPDAKRVRRVPSCPIPFPCDRMTHMLVLREPARGTAPMTDLSADVAALPDKSLLVLDDDAPLRTRLGRALEQRGFQPTLVGSVQEAIAAVRANPPAFAVLDMRLEDGTGLKV